jgi:mannose-6-phosphate isomerase-like protein (cupin superfamily)
MKTMSKLIEKIVVSKDKRKKALVAFQKQMQLWGLKMPSVEPLVLDFGLAEYENTGLIECWIANEIEAGYCGKYLFVFDGQTCPLHKHADKHETFFIVKGTIKVKYKDEIIELNEGSVLPVETGNYHSFTGIGPALILEISMPCIVEDNYFDNTNIPIGENFSKTQKETD